MTIKADAPDWKGLASPSAVKISLGTIVRLFPPADADDDMVDKVKQDFLRLGAIGVRVMPRAKSDRAAGIELAVEQGERPRHREVVMSMAGENEELRALLSRVMDGNRL